MVPETHLVKLCAGGMRIRTIGNKRIPALAPTAVFRDRPSVLKNTRRAGRLSARRRRQARRAVLREFAKQTQWIVQQSTRASATTRGLIQQTRPRGVCEKRDGFFTQKGVVVGYTHFGKCTLGEMAQQEVINTISIGDPPEAKLCLYGDDSAFETTSAFAFVICETSKLDAALDMVRAIKGRYAIPPCTWVSCSAVTLALNQA